MLAGEQRAWAVHIGDNFMRATGGYVRGNLAISLVAGLSSYVVLKILGVPYAETLAVVVAILDIIPLVGATIGAVIVVIVGFAVGGATDGIVLIVYFIVYQQFENNVLQNVIYAKTVALSPLVVFIAALIGASLGGIVGVLLAISIASAAWSIGRDVFQIRQERRGKPEESGRTTALPRRRRRRRGGAGGVAAPDAYTRRVRLPAWTADLPTDIRLHLGNVADNLQLIADLGYGDVALAVAGAGVRARGPRGRAAQHGHRPLRVVARRRRALARRGARGVRGGRGGPSRRRGRRRAARGIRYRTEAYPIGAGRPFAVVLRDVGEQVEDAPGRMETAFMASARDLLDALRSGPLRDARTGGPFSTTRRAGDGVMRVGARGHVTYASPNAVNILRLAGVEGRVTGMRASELPGGGSGIAPVLGTRAPSRSRSRWRAAS